MVHGSHPAVQKEVRGDRRGKGKKKRPQADFEGKRWSLLLSLRGPNGPQPKWAVPERGQKKGEMGLPSSIGKRKFSHLLLIRKGA